MTRKVAVVDYGMSNLRSMSQANLWAAAGTPEEFAEVPVGALWPAVLHAAAGSPFEVLVTSRPEDILAAERVILPGQGAIRDCLRELRESGLLPAVLHAAAHKPLLGVCVGMQMLLDHSEEQDTPGLGLIPGQVKRFRLEGRVQPDGSRYKVPQMGWNRVIQSQVHPLWAGIPDGSWFYFVHSFHAAPSEPRHSAGETDYGGRFTSAVARDNIFATQFHPEKSAEHGLQLYRNFLRWHP